MVYRDRKYGYENIVSVFSTCGDPSKAYFVVYADYNGRGTEVLLHNLDGLKDFIGKYSTDHKIPVVIEKHGDGKNKLPDHQLDFMQKIAEDFNKELEFGKNIARKLVLEKESTAA